MDFLDIVFNILSSGLPCCLLALGIFLTYRLLDFADLTAEGSFLLGAAMTGVLIYNGVNPFLATFLSIIVGALCGVLTGVLNRYLKIPKLLSGIITLTACASIVLIIMGIAKGNESIFKDQIAFKVGKGSTSQTIYSLFTPYRFNEDYGIWQVVAPWGELIKLVIMLIVVCLTMVIIYFFFGTQYGMAIRATGMSEKMARAQGINTDLATIVCVALSNAVIALAGSLYVQEAKSVSQITATGYLVIGLASILVGEAIFGKRSFKNWLVSVTLGSIVYFIIVTIAVRLGFPTELKSLLYAILITIALCIPLFKEGFKKLKKKMKESNESKEAPRC